ncbi:MAG: hypothetical protein E6R04_10610 [Spirochaetes bacterium]|nr:MAG: hypothetical protein E6R04_10610 [Spirochaetota bacterium]
MALWDDLVTEIGDITNRSELTAEIAICLRQAIRNAHRSHKFWKDLAVVSVTGLSADSVPQTFSIATKLPNFRQVAYVKSGSAEKYFKQVTIEDLLDTYGIARTDVYYAYGDTFVVRPYAAETSYDVCYYKQPILSPTSAVDSWIASEYRDVTVAWAASSLLATVGEQEIKSRMDQLTAVGFAQLVQDNVELDG